jgi:uncharacterized protein with ParB-like and HNH nuclease domain
MAPGNEIKSEKILLKDVFDMWFRIPEYQRPYVWGDEQIHSLLDDLTFAATNKPDAEYFLGSLVFQAKPADRAVGRLFDENDLLDGQQRLTTVLLLMAVIRDLTPADTNLNKQMRETCQTCIFQEAHQFKHIPERVRLVFDIRDNVKEFIEKFIKKDGGTLETDAIAAFAKREKDISVDNMAKALVVIRDFLQDPGAMNRQAFFDFLLNKVLMIYVSTEDLEDAFRLFTILNNRGIPLRNSDILKATNLGALDNPADKTKYAKMWEDAEGELGEDFDRFLAHIRTVLVKDKARLSLLREFDDQIYEPKEKDKKTGKKKPVLLKKGKDTFEFVERYLDHYKQLLGGQNYEVNQNFAFDNLIKVMMTGFQATDWIPPLLRYYDKFGDQNLLLFLNNLNAKFAGDWLSLRNPTDRIEAMNAITRIIDDSPASQTVIQSDAFKFDKFTFQRTLEGDIYGRRYALYVLLMLDYLYQNHDQMMHFETLSVEHILPQNPDPASQWMKDFTETQRLEWTNKIGNLVLITRRKNTAQGNRDYSTKKKRYFEKNIDTCPNSLRVLNKYSVWTFSELKENYNTTLEELRTYFKIADSQ